MSASHQTTVDQPQIQTSSEPATSSLLNDASNARSESPPPLSNRTAKSLLVVVTVPSASHHLAPAIAIADPEPTTPSAAISPVAPDTSFVTELRKKQARAFLFGSNEEKKRVQTKRVRPL
jgi:hypothetical protein